MEEKIKEINQEYEKCLSSIKKRDRRTAIITTASVIVVFIFVTFITKSILNEIDESYMQSKLEYENIYRLVNEENVDMHKIVEAAKENGYSIYYNGSAMTVLIKDVNMYEVVGLNEAGRRVIIDKKN